MTEYRGEVIESTDDDFPFLTIIYDDSTGDVVAEFPVRTKADGEAKIVEAIQHLRSKDAGADAA